MNQILVTKLKKSKNKNTRIYKFQFVLSVAISISLILVISYYISSINQKEKLSNKLIDNYNIAKLYATNDTKTNIEENEVDNNLFGIIEIPKIGVYYPVFATLNEELLKVSPCKFYGETLQSYGNICIAGHNYNNSKFFSNLPLLEINDEIFVYDNSGKKYVYKVFDFYEVIKSDLTPIFNYGSMSKELTLITCNNLTSNRFVIKAQQKSHS